MEATETKPVTFIESELKKFNVADAAIAEMKKEYTGLTIAGIDDKEGYEKVHKARMLVRSKRTDVEKKRKELKADSLKFGRAVDAEALRITAMLEEIETPLSKEEERIDAEHERIKLEAEKKEKERIQKRIDALGKFNYVIDYAMVMDMTDERYEIELAHAKESWEREQEAERTRLAEIERQKREEQERIANIKLQQEQEAKRLKEEADKIRAERTRIAKEQEETEKSLKAERDKIAKEQAAREEAIRAERAKIEAEKTAIAEAKRKEEEEKQRVIREQQIAEQARIEAEQKVKREADEKAKQERLAKIEAERQLTLRPDKEKLKGLAVIIQSIQFPELNHADANKILKDIRASVNKCVELINDKIQSL